MRGRVVSLLVAMAMLGGCHSTGPPPNILLVVLDTVRADDVSAYGQIVGTTPTVDRLAGEGLRYAHAYSNASWTLPSHASLFTGLLPHQHGARTITDALPAELVTMAERLRDAGYETAGVSENPWLTDGTGMTQGFETFTMLKGGEPSMPDVVWRWLAGRSPDRPFFLFLNIMDAHAPYKVRDMNPFLPVGTTAADTRGLSYMPGDYLCGARRAEDPAYAILRGLYRGGVKAADVKLGQVLKRIPVSALTIVLSDHGEAFGERGLFGHDMGLAEAQLHIPLVVSGLPDVTPAVIKPPVQLADVLPSVLAWANAEAPKGLIGRPLPTRDARSAPRAIVSEYTDYVVDETVPAARIEPIVRLAARGRSRCGPEHRVFGDMRSLLRFPEKVVSYDAYSPELFDVATDPKEEHDLSGDFPDRMTKLVGELETLTGAGTHGLGARSAMDPAVTERLRALGYLGGPREQ